jgi:hypothetical protein
MPRNWAEEQALRVAVAVFELRSKRGRSAQWLADRTKELGHEVSRSVIADLETGRRRYVTTAEVAMLARALNTSPVALEYLIRPGDGDLSIEMTPGVNARLIDAAQWFSGLADAYEAQLIWVTENAAEYNQNLETLRTWREFWELDRRRSALFQRLWDSRAGKIELSDAERTETIDAMADLERRAKALTASDGW